MSRAYRHNLNGSRLQPGDLQLEISNVTLRFGGVRALDDVSFKVAQGDIHAIIGPNGAGKTSLLNCISGLYRPQVGNITLHLEGQTTWE
ncbi:MAG TPA: ATP-binding cassette domain-containing protein, partial [Acidimicrobiia bacterium]